ncbi:uncharacterized mitochondrial protein AtMg00810-like [Arachis stenosperma]|uniref:uncharacterized mitochondrial protein AtMg00810-like n=1 Tax=Arachis stenosperma TaxID=217475 RepID=UPI0025ABF739|nr:uncharacterized mitochondrial protein AtMg00810-like [Arachis stenosperma]
MKIPQGLTVPESNLVCKLQKSLYGLKQTSRQWNVKLTSMLLDLVYTQSRHRYPLFTKLEDGHLTTISVFVDDLILAGSNLAEINFLNQKLYEAFKTKDIGVLKYFLSLEIARGSKGITMNQRKHVINLLEEFGMIDCKLTSTPMDYSAKLAKDGAPTYSDVPHYKRLLGRLVYLTTTRPDITFAIEKLRHCLDCPTQAHYTTNLCVLKYLKQSPATGLFFATSSNLSSIGFSDAGWAACHDIRQSLTGYCFYLGNSLIS